MCRNVYDAILSNVAGLLKLRVCDVQLAGTDAIILRTYLLCKAQCQATGQKAARSLVHGIAAANAFIAKCRVAMNMNDKGKSATSPPTE